MRVLLSAYACEPGKGSEPEVGWTWAIGLADRGHDTWVITRRNNRAAIEAAIKKKPRSNLHFVYYDLPAWLTKLKRFIGVNLYYRLWQAGVTTTARRLHSEIIFDRAHHATFVVVRHPSFLRHLSIPFVFGPVAGGEVTPSALLTELPLRYQFKEWTRAFGTKIAMCLPSVRQTLRAAEIVAVTSPETRALLPKDVRGRSIVQLAIVRPPALSEISSSQERREQKPLRALYVGRLLYWKGIHLAIRALARAIQQGADVNLTIVGDGPDGQWLRDCANRLEVGDRIQWIQWLPREELGSIYAAHDVLIFPSFHDSGGMVVLEAMQHALPVLCLNLGGPGVMVNSDCGMAVPVERSPESVCALLGDKLREWASDPELLVKLKAAALRRAEEFSRESLLGRFGY